MKYKPLLLATMSEAGDVMESASISEAPMSSDVSELEQYWTAFVERAVPGATLTRVDDLRDGAGRVRLRYTPPWEKEWIGSFMDAANALKEYCITNVDVRPSELRFQYISCSNMSVRPSLCWDSRNLEPAVDPGSMRASESKAMDYNKKIDWDAHAAEADKRIRECVASRGVGAVKPSLSPQARAVCEQVMKAEQERFSALQQAAMDAIHPVQLAREMKAASEPPSGNERNTGGYTAATFATMAKAKAARPGFRFSQRNAPPGQVSWNDDWDRHVNSLITTQLAAFERSVQKQQVRETRLAHQTEPEKSRVAALVVDQFQRLAEARAAEDAKVVEEHQKALAVELAQLEAVRFQQRLFASMCFFVAFLVVMYAGWWVQ